MTINYRYAGKKIVGLITYVEKNLDGLHGSSPLGKVVE